MIKEKSLTKDGKETYTPKLLRGKDGKIVYEDIKGNFLNNDQFWKSRGGKTSYANLQDSFNKFITDKGFKLYRGDIGANVEYQSKLEYQVKELEAQLDGIKTEIDYSNKELADNKKTIDDIHKDNSTETLNPKKGLIGYNSDDVAKIIDYSKDLEKKETIYNNEIQQKDKLIDKLTTENTHFKDNGELKKEKKLLRIKNKSLKKKKK